MAHDPHEFPLTTNGLDMINAFEIAALVYDDGVSVDHLMGFFAEDVAAAGCRVGGVVQLPPDEETGKTGMRVLDLMTGDVIAIQQCLGSGSASCKLDASALALSSIRIRRAIEDRVDLLFISKFGKQEASGAGFRAEFGAAVLAGIPILTSVKRPMVQDWLGFTGGIGTLLACRLRTLRDWWQETEQSKTRYHHPLAPTDAPQEEGPKAEIIPLFPQKH